jgi:hypothetical protein
MPVLSIGGEKSLGNQLAEQIASFREQSLSAHGPALSAAQ